MAVDTQLMIHSPEPGEQIGSNSSDHTMDYLIHELVHAGLQFGLVGSSTGAEAWVQDEPRWLTEGMAQLLQALPLFEHRKINDANVRRHWVSRAKSTDIHLRDTEIHPSNQPPGVVLRHDSEEIIDCTYMCGAIAVELLGSHIGWNKLSNFWMELEPRMAPPGIQGDRGWTEAFERAYGMTVDEFYKLFEEHRAAGFPNVEIPEFADKRQAPTPTPSPNPAVAPIPVPPGQQSADDYIVWKIGSEVSHTAETAIRSTVQSTHDVAVSNGLPRIDRPITIFVYHNPDSLATEFESTFDRAMTEIWFWPDLSQGRLAMVDGRDWIAMNISAGRYQEYSSRKRREELTKCLVDVYRRALTGVWQGTPDDEVDPEGPEWLRQGASRFYTQRAIGPIGSKSCDLSRSHFIGGAAQLNMPLSEIETSSGFRPLVNGQGYAFLAVELLAHQAGKESIFAYFASLKTGVTWQEAFKRAFGMTVEKFYQLFEEHRASGFPEPGIPKSTNGPTTTPGPFSELLQDTDLPSYLRWDIGSEVDRSQVESAVREAKIMHKFGKSLVLSQPRNSSWRNGTLDTGKLMMGKRQFNVPSIPGMTEY